MNKLLDNSSEQTPLALLLFEGESKLSKALEKYPIVTKDISKAKILANDKPMKCIIQSTEDDVTEVVNLKNTIVSKLPKSDIVERYNKSRQQKHTDTIAEIHLTLEFFGNETKEGLQYVFQHLSSNINENHKEIDEMLRSLKCTELFQSDSDIENLWACIDAKYEENKIWLEEFCFTLGKQETFKLYKIQELLRKATKKLEAIGYWAQTDIKDYIFKLAMELQKLSLINQKYFVELKWILIMQDVELKIKQCNTWYEFWGKWLKDIQISSLNQFKASLKALSDGEYGYIKNAIIKFIYDCDAKARERLTMLYAIRNIKPPNWNRDTVRSWAQSYAKLNNEHEKICLSFGKKIKMDNPKLQKQLTDDLENIKKSLINRNICSTKTVNQILGIEHFKLMEDYLIFMNFTVQKVKKKKQYQKDGLDGLEKSIIEAVEKAIELWEFHQLALNDLNKNVDKKLDKFLNELNEYCNYEEKNVGIALDQLPQAESEDTLEETMKSVLQHFSTIKDKYKLYADKRIEIINSYPSLILLEINRYRIELKNFFGISAGHLLDPIVPFLENIQDERSCLRDTHKKNENESNPQPAVDSSKRHSVSASSDKSAEQKKVWKDIDIKGLPLPFHPSGTLSNIELTVTQILTLPGQVLSSSQLTKWPCPDIWTGSETRLQHTMRILSVNFAVHWENWLLQSIRQADAIRQSKIVEINNELEFRLKVQTKRIKGIQKNMVNIRKKELANHVEVVLQHISKVIELLENEKDKLKNLPESQSKSLNALVIRISQKEDKMLLATAKEHFSCQKKELESMIIQYVADEIKELDKRDADGFCNNLLESNRKFMATLKPFSQSGNYSETEISKFNHEIMDLNTKIMNFRDFSKQILSELENKWKFEKESLLSSFFEKWEFAEADLELSENINYLFRSAISQIKSEVIATATESRKLQKEIDRMNTLVEKGTWIQPDSLSSYLDVCDNVVSGCVQRGIQLGVISEPEPEPAPVEKKAVKEKKKTKPGGGSSPFPKEGAQVKYTTKQYPDLLFSEQPEGGQTFQAIVQNILWNTQNNVALVAEDYYSKRGSRPSVFEDRIPDNIEMSHKDIKNTLQNFLSQSKDFLVDNILDFCSQAKQVETVTSNFVSYVFDLKRKTEEIALETRVKSLVISIDEIMDNWNRVSTFIKNQLHPHLVYPSYKANLEKLIDNAAMEKENYKRQLSEHCRELLNDVKRIGNNFVKELNELASFLMKSLDSMLTAKEVSEIKTDTDSASFTPHSVPTVPQQTTAKIWPGLKNYSWNKQTESEETFITAPIEALRTHDAQNLVIESRDTIYTAFYEVLNRELNEINVKTDEQIYAIDEWYEYFVCSLNDLKDAVVLFQ